VRTLIALFIALAPAFAADFQAGLDAYRRGNFTAAAQEWRPLAEQGDAHSQYNLGLLCARGQGLAQDYAQAAEWYRKAAEQGVVAAQYNLGVMYANGQGVPKNPEEAAKWFRKAADQNMVAAETGLARMYSEADGAFRNYGEAVQWYRKAADAGVASAAFDLGVMYDLGQGVQPDYAEALRWYRKAADAGYAPALVNIGVLYYNQQGVKRDLVQAYAWFDRALKMGDPRAKELLDTTAERMKPKDVTRAQTLSAEWKPPTPKQPSTDVAELFLPQPAETAATAATTVATAPAAASENRGTDTSVHAAQTARLGTRVSVPTPAAPPPPLIERAVTPAAWTGVERVIAIGDVHGDYEQFVAVLRSAGLIDSTGNWTGGKAHLVQTGDIVDRGPDSRAVMDLLMKLEKQAAEAGGAVHCLIGNHEAMDLYGDLRFVSPGEYAAFRTGGGEASRYEYPEHPQDLTAPATLAAESAAPPADMPGYRERVAALEPGGEYGKWIRSHDAVIKIDRTLFVHAGLGQKYADWPIDRINAEVHQELNDFRRLHGGVVTDEEGPLWFSGLAKGDERQLQPLVDALLKHFDVDRIVIGHTYAQGAITPRFGGKVILIDIGLSRVYDNVGKVGCLEIDGPHAYALHRGQGLELPKDEGGADMLRYLQQAAALDPKPSPLEKRIGELKK
jgi:TPR repeat protein